jgi:hypothetical protein
VAFVPWVWASEQQVKVYQNLLVLPLFPLQLFCSVSENFSVLKFVLHILMMSILLVVPKLRTEFLLLPKQQKRDWGYGAGYDLLTEVVKLCYLD